ncbi:MAG: hypothetical protein QOJ89_2486 [bacterium]
MTDLARLAREPLSRRRLLRLSGAGAVAGSAALLAACGDKKPNTTTTLPPNDADVADVEILNGVLDLELMSIEAYKAGAAALTGAPLATVKRFLEQEQEHVDALSSAIKNADGSPNAPKSSYRFPRMRNAREVLRYAVSFEGQQIAAYIDALPKLTNTDVRGTIAGILTTEGEHVAVLRGELGQAPVQKAFVTGDER